ncbi:MAG: MFS transporter [Tatlockia sp.]|nr:MFS transporter [Tatlockia sp.]
MLILFRDQPRAFYTIFLLEIWERFGFYTMQGVLILFFIRYLNFSDRESYYIFGAFSALVYSMVALGGYLGDKILGTKRTIVLGLITLALGYLSLSFAGKAQIYQALGLICVGNGLFKANPSSLLAKCYQKNDPRLHGGFTLYYMAINLGSIVALLVGPEVANHFGYSYAFFLSFIGLSLGLVNYYLQRKNLANIYTEADRRVVYLKIWTLVIGGIITLTLISAYLLQHFFLARNLFWPIFILVTGIYCNYMRKETKASRIRMIVAYILMLQAVLFFTLYQQMPTSLNLFAVNNVEPKLFGIRIDPQSFQSLNPIWIIIMSPILAMLYHKANQRGRAIHLPYKFAAGMLCCAFGFCILFFARYAHNGEGLVKSWWLILSYLFQSTGELLVSALGVAMVAELVPRKIAGFVMGLWFLITAMAGFLGASVASLTALPNNLQAGVESLFIYTKAFASIGLVTLVIGIIMLLFAPKLTRYISSSS